MSVDLHSHLPTSRNSSFSFMKLNGMTARAGQRYVLLHSRIVDSSLAWLLYVSRAVTYLG
jgi:hypothetical protein